VLVGKEKWQRWFSKVKVMQLMFTMSFPFKQAVLGPNPLRLHDSAKGESWEGNALAAGEKRAKHGAGARSFVPRVH
jgi:hypothetical protein